MEPALLLDAEEAAAAIRRGGLRGDALLARLGAIPAHDRDVWLDVVLGLEAAPSDEDLPRGAVPYLPCAVDEIVTAVRELPLRANDVLVDIGAGLGRVVVLAHLLSGARARGIELQAPLAARAAATCAALGLSNVAVEHANALEARLDGNVFFLYAPCNGAMMRELMARLEREARARVIKLCAVDLALGEVAWLVPRKTASPSLVLYESVTAPHTH